jgi:N-hydroxyarylamine O-acetyltransferase
VDRFDLDAYLARIGWLGDQHPTPATLASLMRAHMAAIPFENLDVLLGRPVQLDLDSIFAKMVVARRGGYCFEHATLFHAVLERFGYEVQTHAARVVMFTPRSEAARTHMLITVGQAARPVIVDPGFGGHGPQMPLTFVPGQEVGEGAECHRCLQEDNECLLQARISGDWVSLWTSTLEPLHPVDFVMANHYVSTYRDSPFVNRLMLRAITPEGRTSVMNRDVTVRRGTEVMKYQLADRGALRGLLARDFGIDLPEVEQLRIPSVPEWA